MRTFALCAILATAALADKADFPKDDAMHADCHLTAYFDTWGCDALFDTAAYVVGQYQTAETSPAGGIYQWVEEAAYDYIWTTRLTKNGKYTDDQLFEFEQVQSDT